MIAFGMRITQKLMMRIRLPTPFLWQNLLRFHLLGKAIQEGKIKSLEQPVSDFFPEFKDYNGTALTVGDLASMSSGLDWDESYYNPFSQTARAYFGEILERRS